MKEQIKKMYENGMMIKDIAKKFNCERHTISRVLKENDIKGSRHELLKGKTFTNNSGDKYIVIEDFTKNGKGYCKIKFIDTGYETIKISSNVKNGSIKDYYKRTIYGVACKGSIICPKGSFEQLCFHRWEAMISRCYNKKDTNYKAYGGRGVKVSESWLIFENYCNDIQKLSGFDKEKYIKHEIELDKDTGKEKFSKEYSKENCQFLPLKDNRRYQRRNIKPFKAISPNGEIRIYETQSDCAKDLNLIARTIGKCLHKQLLHHHGYSFEYLEPQTTIPNGSSE